jgi:hypothetical protein
MLKKIENMLRMGPVESVLVITLICVLMSVTITVFTFFVFGKEIHWVVLLVAITAPLIIAPLVSSLLIKLVIEKEAQKKKIYRAGAIEAKKILKEFLHDVEYFDSEAERIGGFDGNTMQHLESALKRTQDKLDGLDDVSDITGQNKIVT